MNAAGRPTVGSVRAAAARGPTLAAVLLLAALALLVFARTVSFDFVHLDDDVYVTHNPQVAAGLSAHGVRWAFTTTHAGFWQPLTWLSLMLDAQLFGLKAGGFHATNVALHVLNTVAIFLVLKSLTGAAARSLVVAALFAVHPLHVESVAWVTERKDLLFAAFGFAALGAYVRYARRPRNGGMALVALAYAGSLMAKQMLVTLPFLLLALDYWPLDRLGLGRNPRPGRTALAALVVEKTPLILLAAVFSAVAYAAQRSWGAVTESATLPLTTRLGAACVAYAGYLGKAIWPARLSAIYLSPDSGHPWPLIGISAVLLLLASAIVVMARRPPLTVGWVWFLGTLVPVIGIVQIGMQFMADRFMYLPLVGLLVAGVWSAGDFLARRRGGRMAGRLLAVAVTAALLVTAAARTSAWRDSASLFGDALASDPRNWLARYFLGNALLEQRRFAEAAESYGEGLRMHPNFRRGRNNLGLALLELDRPEEAVVQFRLSILGKADDPLPHANLGDALARLGRTAEAISQLREAVRLNPANIQARNNLGSLLAREGHAGEARAQFAEALRIAPGYATARANLERLDRAAGRK